MQILFSGDIMKKENRIRAFFIAGTGILIGGYTVANSFLHPKEAYEEPIVKQVHETEKKEETTAVSNEQEAYEYVIVNENGFLTVYRKDLKTVYLKTDIPYSRMSVQLKEEIDHGYPIRDTAELYNFLENYSS